jgi:hypothetical protein
MHGLTGGGWKRKRPATVTGVAQPTGNHRKKGPGTYRRPAPPRQPPTLLRLAQRFSVLRKLDGWLRRRLRQVRWKEWKTTAAKRHNLRIRGISESEARKWAGISRRYWRVAGSQVLQVSLPNSYWNRLGLTTLSQTWQRLGQTA